MGWARLGWALFRGGCDPDTGHLSLALLLSQQTKLLFKGETVSGFVSPTERRSRGPGGGTESEDGSPAQLAPTGKEVWRAEASNAKAPAGIGWPSWVLSIGQDNAKGMMNSVAHLVPP